MIVYNYETGEVLVKVSTPTFDPNAVPEDIETNDAYKGAYLDNTLSGSFTPGSIFKIVTAAAAMEKYPDTWSSLTYDCQGSVELAGSGHHLFERPRPRYPGHGCCLGEFLQRVLCPAGQ